MYKNEFESLTESTKWSLFNEVIILDPTARICTFILRRKKSNEMIDIIIFNPEFIHNGKEFYTPCHWVVRSVNPYSLAGK